MTFEKWYAAYLFRDLPNSNWDKMKDSWDAGYTRGELKLGEALNGIIKQMRERANGELMESERIGTDIGEEGWGYLRTASALTELVDKLTALAADQKTGEQR